MILPFFGIDTNGLFRLAIMPHPPGGDRLDEAIRSLRANRVDVLVSMLLEDEAGQLGLSEEGHLCATHEIQFLSFPILDHGIPDSTDDAIAFARRLGSLLETGKIVVIHCFAGIGRSGLMAAATMILAGFTTEDAILRVTAARGCMSPETLPQRDWLLNVPSP